MRTGEYVLFLGNTSLYSLLRDLEIGEEPDDIELWDLSHVKNGEWSNNESQDIFNNACAQVIEKETREEGPISNDDRNTIFQTCNRTSVGCKSSESHGRSYMAKLPTAAQRFTATDRLRAEIDEQARLTTETQRQNEELNLHVQNLENKNEDMNLHVQNLENKSGVLNRHVQN